MRSVIDYIVVRRWQGIRKDFYK